MHELKEFAVITVYLYITLGAVIMMKAAVLHTEGIAFAPWGIAIVKAAVLAKFMLIGNAMRFGERTKTRPLIWPTMHKAAAFLVLLIVLTIIEEAVVGTFHHRSIAASLGDLFGPRLDETLAGYVIMLLVLVPFSPSASLARRSVAKTDWSGCSSSSATWRSGGNLAARLRPQAHQ